MQCNWKINFSIEHLLKKKLYQLTIDLVKILYCQYNMKIISITFLTAFTILLCSKTSASVLVADNTMSKMVELNADAPFCALYDDRGVIQRMVLGADPKKVRQMSSNLVADLEETCKESRRMGKKHAPGSGLIYPGTKWCGPGTLADSYNDLGTHSREDACCREHDHCAIVVNPHQCLNGICNHSPFTRSHCDCDAKFRRCLQNLNTEVANTLGALFFNVIQVTCFQERRPCSQWQRTGYDEAESNRLCAQYIFQPSEKYVPLMPLNMNI